MSKLSDDADSKLVSEATTSELIDALKRRHDAMVFLGVKESNESGGQVAQRAVIYGYTPLAAGCVECLRELMAHNVSEWAKSFRTREP